MPPHEQHQGQEHHDDYDLVGERNEVRDRHHELQDCTHYKEEEKLQPYDCHDSPPQLLEISVVWSPLSVGHIVHFSRYSVYRSTNRHVIAQALKVSSDWFDSSDQRDGELKITSAMPRCQF